MINKKIIMFVGMVLLVAGVAYASGVVLFGGNAYESNEDKLVLDMDLTEANYDSGTKTFADDSGEGNDGVSVNAATFTTDKYGMSTGAMDFNGGSDFVNVSSVGDFDNMSINIWVNAKTDTHIWSTLLSSQSFRFSISAANTIGMGWTNGSICQHFYASTGFSLEEWHLVSATKSGNTLKIYIDGIERGSGAISYSRTINDFQIGQDSLSGIGGVDRIKGSISQVKIYNRSLSATEVMALYNSSKPKVSGSSLSKGLIGHWELDSASYNSATDRVADKTPYSNHGVNYGATLTTDQMGQSNRAMSFDGNGYWINITPLNLGSTLTISAWAKSTASSLSDMLWCIDNDNHGPDLIFYTDLISLNTWNAADNPFCSIPSDVDEWHLYTTLISSGTTELYIDGELCGSANYANPTGTSLYISSGAGYGWEGSISDFRIYDRVLSVGEINALYSSYRPKAASGSLYKGLVLDMPLTSKYITGDTPGSELIRDKTPYSNDGQNSGATIGSNYSNFAPNDNIVVPDNSSLNITGSLTIGFWLNLNTLLGPSNYQDIALKWNNAAPDSWAFVVGDTSGEMEFWWVNGENSALGHRDSTNANLQINQWYYLSAVYNQSGSNVTLYKNGQQLAYTTTGSVPPSIKSSTDSVTLGKRINSNSYALNGSISSAKIYNRALLESEIKLLYDKGR